jgi:hypothetical protein
MKKKRRRRRRRRKGNTVDVGSLGILPYARRRRQSLLDYIDFLRRSRW